MKRESPFIPSFISRLVIALAILCLPLQVVSARKLDSISRVETGGLSVAADNVPGARFVHTATNANTSGNHTYIDHPLTNGNPNAIVLVTQNWNPGGVGGTYNDHPIGVYYSGGEQKWAVFNQDLASMPLDAAFDILIPIPGADAFVHTATASNTAENWTVIDHPLTNNNPNAIVLVTQNWNPGESAGTYNNHPIGVWYYSGIGKWAIFNQDNTSNMPTGADFNVLIPIAHAEVIIHTATTTNITGNSTFIDHPRINNNPNAILLVTQNWNPSGVGNTYNNYPIGVWYSHGAKKWAIFNQDNTSSMPEDAAFNVLFTTTESAVFIHTTTVANIVSNYTYIDHSLTNENPNAIFFVTPNWNPIGVGGAYNDHPIGVWYSHGAKKWAIFNQDLASMPDGVAFNILIPSVDTSVFVHFARTGSIVDNYTLIDHPLTNNNPNAILLVTQNWNPSGVGNTYNNHPIGVWYSSSAQKWSIFNQDNTSIMPVDAAFNVLVGTANSHTFVHNASGANTIYNYTLIDHILTNENTNALLFATQNWNPGGVGGTYNDYPIGVWYSNSAKKWSIFNQDKTSSMPIGADFNIIVMFNRVYLSLVLR